MFFFFFKCVFLFLDTDFFLGGGVVFCVFFPRTIGGTCFVVGFLMFVFCLKYQPSGKGFYG